MTTQRPSITVVGGGIAGLVAAITAAEHGQVTLYERGSLGGRARTRSTDAGFRLNHGPHALYVDAALHSTLSGFGIDVAGTAPPAANGRGQIGERLGLLPAGPLSLLRTDLVSARSKVQVARFLATIGKVDTTGLGSTSTAAWLDGEGLRPDVRRLVEALVRLTSYCVDLDIVSADATVTQLANGLEPGVLYLDDGWQQMVDRLADNARTSGVTLRSDATVRSVEHGAVVLDDGSSVDHDAVILAGLAPEQVTALVPGAPDLRDAAGPVVEAATLDLGLRGTPEIDIVLGVDTPLYYSRHSPPAALAPAGHSLYGAMRYLRAGEKHDREQTAAELEAVALRAGVAADDIVERRYQHRLTVAQGQPLAAGGGLNGRPTVEALGQPGIFVAGDWVGSNGMLADASAASAVTAARAAVAHASSVRS